MIAPEPPTNQMAFSFSTSNVTLPVPNNDMNSPITDQEREAFFKLLKPAEVTAFNELLKRNPSWSKYNPRFTLKFLFARKMDVARAEKLLQNHLEWRVKYEIDNINYNEMRRFLDLSFFSFQPDLRDKAGRGVCYLFPRAFEANLLADTKKYVQFTWWIGLVASQVHIDNDREGYVYIEDFAGASFSNLAGMGGDKTMKEMFNSIQNCVPARLRRIYLLNAPWYVRFLLAMVKPFMSAKLQGKVQSVTLAELGNEFQHGSGSLLIEVGGNTIFNYKKWLADKCTTPS